MEQEDLEIVKISSIKIIKIFLASSSELKGDREQFEIFINRKNKEYIRKGIFLELVMWEDFLDAMARTRLQDEYNNAIANCDVFVSLFRTKVGQYTEEEFEKAFTTFKANKKLLIYTYFKDSSIPLSQVTSEINSLLNFKRKLSELGHFYTAYKEINHLKYLFAQQLDKFIPELTNIQQENLSSSDIFPKKPGQFTSAIFPNEFVLRILNFVFHGKKLQDISQDFLEENSPVFPEKLTSVTKSVHTPSGVGLKEFGFQVVTVNDRGEQVKQARGQAQYFTEELGHGVTLDMIAIPGGKFLMGTEDREIERLCKKYNVEYFRREKPQHEVTVQSFFMGKYPVTQGQWKAVASLSKVERKLDLDPSYCKGDNRPVEQVSWKDAVEFCRRLSKQTGKEYRLPSEAEWEYACRAGTTTPFHFGETITDKLAKNYYASEMYANKSKGEYCQENTTVGFFS